MANYVLVHGSGHGAWCWDLLVPHLKANPRVGRVLAVELVGRGTRLREKPHDKITREDYVKDVVDAVLREDLRDIVLVGHSYAGTFMPQVVSRLPGRVRRMVLVAGMVTPEGKTSQEVVFALGYKRITQTNPSLSMEQVYRLRILNDVSDEATIQWVMKNINKEPLSAMLGPVTWEGYPMDLPTTYVVTTKDQTMGPELQRKLLGYLPSPDVVELEAGHDAMVSRPRELADILLRYA